MNDKMTFNELVDQIAAETGVPREVIADMFKESVTLAHESLDQDGQATLRGLGKFSLRWHEARQGRNPQTGETLQIPAHNSIVFKPDSELRKYINRKFAHLKLKILKSKGPDGAVDEIILEEDDGYSEPADDAEETAAFEQQDTKKSFNWLWLIIPLLIIIIAFLVWPKGNGENAEIVKVPESSELMDTKRESENEPTNETVGKSRENVQISEAESSDGTTITAATYTVGAKDRLWTLSQNHYSQGNLWPNIYRVNRQTVRDPDVLIIGSRIDVPALEGAPGNLTEQDKQNIANGFLDVYQAYVYKNKYDAFHYLWVARELGGEELLNSADIPQKDLERINKFESTLQIQ